MSVVTFNDVQGHLRSIKKIRRKKQKFNINAQMSAGPSTPVYRWALPAGRSSHRTSIPAVGRLRQTRRATDSHSHWSQKLSCFRSWDLEQFTSWTASVDTVHGHLRTTPERASLRQHWWHVPATRLILLKPALFITRHSLVRAKGEVFVLIWLFCSFFVNDFS